MYFPGVCERREGTQGPWAFCQLLWALPIFLAPSRAACTSLFLTTFRLWVTSLPVSGEKVAGVACRWRNPEQESGGLAQPLMGCVTSEELLALSGPPFPLLHNKRGTGFLQRAFQELWDMWRLARDLQGV